MKVKMILTIFSSLIAIMSSLNDCNKSTPIFYNDTCVLGICRNGNYELGGECEVANKIVQIQWVTSVIFINMSNNYVFFQKYENGDLILEILPSSGSYKRMFYELKQNEEIFLVKDGEFTPSLTLNSNYTSSYNGNLFLIKIGEDEYPVFFGSYSFGIELYDLKEGKVYNNRNPTFLDGENFLNVFVSNITINNTNYYLLTYNTRQKSKLKICKFNSKFLENVTVLFDLDFYKKSTIINSIYLTCFASDSNKILCMYLEEEMKYVYNGYASSWDREIRTYILAYNENLEEQNKTAFYKESIPIGTELYEFTYKFLHLKGNTEVFLYMNTKIFVINYNQENKKFKNYFPEQDFTCIELLFTDDRIKYYAKFFTELLKISDSKLCYVSSPLLKDEEDLSKNDRKILLY